MTSIAFRERVDSLFVETLQELALYPELEKLQIEVNAIRERIKKPLRVAIVGKIKSGKSTMMNALLGEYLAATGSQPLTFNVNWLRYGLEPKLIVHFKDERPVISRSIEELEMLTRRSEDNLLRSGGIDIRTIDFIEVFHPNPILKRFDLIDTPGFKSFFEIDSENTMRRLGLTEEELDKRTEVETSKADAVLYLFSRQISASDQVTMEEFQRSVGQRLNAINAIGVMTQCDRYWQEGADNPFVRAREILGKMQTKYSTLRRLFYHIYPVCGLLAYGSQTLTETDLDIFKQLSKLPKNRLREILGKEKQFEERVYDDVTVSPEARKLLLRRFGAYGIWLTCNYVRDSTYELASLREQLFADSGVPEMMKVVQSHFGNRSLAIQLMWGLDRIVEICTDYRRQLPKQPVISDIEARFDRFRLQEHTFKEIYLLRNYYNNQLKFTPDEEKQVLEVTGEYGVSCGQRLGMDEHSHIGDMITAAEQYFKYWQARSSDNLFVDNATLEAAEIMFRSYDRILFHLRKANEHLYL